MAELLKKEGLIGMTRMVRRLFQDCERVQKTVLKELLRANQDTEFGRAHHFSDIGSVKAFRRAMPVSEWSDYNAEMKRLENGEADILFPGNPTLPRNWIRIPLWNLIISSQSLVWAGIWNTAPGSMISI